MAATVAAMHPTLAACCGKHGLYLGFLLRATRAWPSWVLLFLLVSRRLTNVFKVAFKIGLGFSRRVHLNGVLIVDLSKAAVDCSASYFSRLR